MASGRKGCPTDNRASGGKDGAWRPEKTDENSALRQQ